MLRPFLLVGVGGSGGKTLRVVRENLLWQLRERGWPLEQEGFPKAWQFLQIDVASEPDGHDPDLPAQLPPGDFLGMVRNGLTYAAMDTTLTQSLPAEHQLDCVGGWRPDPNKVQVAITRGAGQYRTLGRVVALTRLGEIKRRVDRAVDAITDVDVARQLGRLTTTFGQGADRPSPPEPMAVVVSSIAGGSGAGAVLEICDVLRAAGKSWLDESVGVLYAPDVFDELPEAARRGVRPNALATLSELIAGSWSFDGRDGGITDSSARLYQASGVETTSISRMGPRYPVLVGARNSDVSYGSQNEIYRGMGRAISEWVTKTRLQDAMFAYFSGNRQSSAVAMTDRIGLKLGHHETPFSALGFARMDLGRDLFARYSSQYLARAAAERITQTHLAGRPADDLRTDKEVITDLAEQAWPSFLSHSGLDERGTESNQVMDVLRPDNRKALAQAWRAQVRDSLQSGVPADGLPAHVWQERVERALREQGPALADDLRRRRLEQAKRWVSSIQITLAHHVLRSLASRGGPVTIDLLERLAHELETIIQELPEERAQQEQKQARAAADIRKELGQDSKSRLPQDSPLLEKAVERAAASIGFQAEAELRQLVEELLRDLKTGLLKPLTRAVDHGVAALREDTVRRGGRPAEIDHWPTGDTIPSRLAPARNEFLLDDVQQFPETMRGLLMRDTRRDVSGDAEAQVVQDIIVGGDSSKREPDAAASRVWHTTRSWVPTVAGVADAMSAPAHAAMSLDLKAHHLLSRAQSWVADDQRQFGRHLKQSLSDHLTDANATPTEKADRLQKFGGQLHAAIKRAYPLVDIDREVLSLVHDTSDPRPTLVIDQIPLAADSDAAKKATDVLASSDLVGGKDRFTDLWGQSVPVFQILTEPYEPTVFTSLMRPMANEWAEAKMSDDSRQTFWTWRRSRTLPEFVPAAPAVRRAMVRGWFTALLLGQVSGHELPSAGGISVWVPSPTGGAGKHQPFPHPLLRPYSALPEAPAAVLESLPIALLDVYTSRSLDPLKAFHRLRDLGSAGHMQGMESYETLNEELDAWIRRGHVMAGAPTPDSRVGQPGDDADQRRKAVAARVEALRNAYRNRFQELRKRGSLVGVPRDFELQHDIFEALGDLLEAVESQQDGDEDVFG